ncbi:MAG: hypothetical protein K8U57_33555 [Planctomycetes bacterium]|nr:hypothetical protein [Planctomycetota bacterium]
MTKPILIAGLLGGLLGGMVSFAASRWIKPVEPAKPRPEARDVAEAFVAKLKATKFDEFALDARFASANVTEEAFAKFKDKLTADRQLYANLYGSSTGEFDLLRETVLSPSLVRYEYLEKFERGGVIWFFVLYRGKDSWKLSFVDWTDKLALGFAGIP